jgi:tetratricopeptide (TPR) repeat protein
LKIITLTSRIGVPLPDDAPAETLPQYELPALPVRGPDGGEPSAIPKRPVVSWDLFNATPGLPKIIEGVAVQGELALKFLGAVKGCVARTHQFADWTTWADAFIDGLLDTAGQYRDAIGFYEEAVTRLLHEVEVDKSLGQKFDSAKFMADLKDVLANRYMAASQQLEAKVADREKALADEKKALADREKALADREKDLADREKALADEKDLLAHDRHSTGRFSNWGNTSQTDRWL